MLYPTHVCMFDIERVCLLMKIKFDIGLVMNGPRIAAIRIANHQEQHNANKSIITSHLFVIGNDIERT